VEKDQISLPKSQIKLVKKSGSRRYFVLTDRYLDWYLTPKGQRKGSVPLDNIYVRQETEKDTLVIGQYGRPKEFKMKYQGPNPRDEVQRWYDEITETIDDFKKRKMDNGGENFKIVVDQGFERKDDFLEGNNVEETFTTTVVQNTQQPQPQPQVVQQIINPPTPPIQTTTFVNPQPMYTPPITQTFVSPQPMFNPYVQTTMMQPPQMQLFCQFCRNQFSGAPIGGLVRCPFCHNVNNFNQPMMSMPMTTTTYTSIPPYY